MGTMLLLLGGVAAAAAHAGCAHEKHIADEAPPVIGHVDYGEHPFELQEGASAMLPPDDLSDDERPRAEARVAARAAAAARRKLAAWHDDVAANNEWGSIFRTTKTNVNRYGTPHVPILLLDLLFKLAA